MPGCPERMAVTRVILESGKSERDKGNRRYQKPHVVSAACRIHAGSVVAAARWQSFVENIWACELSSKQGSSSCPLRR